MWVESAGPGHGSTFHFTIRFQQADRFTTLKTGWSYATAVIGSYFHRTLM
jgi:hypothetical protein